MDREGILNICTLQNTAAAGRMPVDKLVTVKTAYYRKRTVGYNRMYAAMGANKSIDMLVRCFNTSVPDYARELYVYFPDDSSVQFRVSAIQEIVEDGAIDLTLERMETLYEVVAEQSEEDTGSSG